MEDDVMSHIDLDGFFGDLPKAGDVIGACSSTNASSSSLDSGLLWFDEIENILMKDDKDGGVVGGEIRANSSQEFCDRFLADVLVDSLGDGSAEIANGSGDEEEPGSSNDGRVDAAKVDGAKGGGEAYDPAFKKLRRSFGEGSIHHLFYLCNSVSWERKNLFSGLPIDNREYEEFKVRINALVAKAQKMPEEGWTMQNGTAWPGNNPRDHLGMIQVFLGHNGGLDTDGNELPRLVYVSREKRPGFQHHEKAGAMIALVLHHLLALKFISICIRILINGSLDPGLSCPNQRTVSLNVDCDHYFNNSKALKEAMCFMMDPAYGKKTCYVQFPQRFDGIDLHDRYANRNIIFFDINLKGLDGIQGPVYVGTGCCFNRQALYGYDPVLTEEDLEPNIIVRSCCGSRKKGKGGNKKYIDKKRAMKRTESTVPIFNMEDVEEEVEGYDDERSLLMSQKSLEKRFGQSPGGLPPSTNPATYLKEAIHVISCGYEDKTEWGQREDILTGFKMCARGWISIYCMPPHPAFKGSAPINLSDRLNQVLRWALGSIEILLSRHCPIWYGYNGKLKLLERLAYINTIVCPLTSILLIAYCILPAFCLLTNKFIIPEISNFASMWFILLFVSIFATGILKLRWSGVSIEDWWRNEQFWVIGVTLKAADEEGDFAELYVFKWTSLRTTILIVNIIGIVAVVSYAMNSGYQSWGPLFGKLFFAIWVIADLYPFLKGLLGRQNRTRTIVIVWSILLASIFSLLWVRIDPFTSASTKSATNGQCSINC
ncbi:hypothetical protein ACJRO7_004464 [Eucalyptus globulus]|uniref:Cellulose synthase n=1 Tax=Eucalyptus globulus TaxID=34317 RepID=A0ABD3J036_EUCGL